MSLLAPGCLNVGGGSMAASANHIPYATTSDAFSGWHITKVALGEVKIISLNANFLECVPPKQA